MHTLVCWWWSLTLHRASEFWDLLLSAHASLASSCLALRVAVDGTDLESSYLASVKALLGHVRWVYWLKKGQFTDSKKDTAKTKKKRFTFVFQKWSGSCDFIEYTLRKKKFNRVLWRKPRDLDSILKNILVTLPFTVQYLQYTYSVLT